MNVVQFSGALKSELQACDQTIEPANSNNKTADVVRLVANARLAKNVPAKPVYKQVEALLITAGVNFGCDKVRADFKIISYLVQGLMDRADGQLSSDRCVMLDTLRLAFVDEETVPDDTQELFGDLLGQLR